VRKPVVAVSGFVARFSGAADVVAGAVDAAGSVDAVDSVAVAAADPAGPDTDSQDVDVCGASAAGVDEPVEPTLVPAAASVVSVGSARSAVSGLWHPVRTRAADTAAAATVAVRRRVLLSIPVMLRG
jgi:hypothetical protein